MTNAALLTYGYKTQSKIAHKLTSDVIIALVLNDLKAELLENYEKIREDALEIANAKSEAIIESYRFELEKRSRVQYDMLEKVKEEKASTSLQRATEFFFEINKLIKKRRF